MAIRDVLGAGCFVELYSWESKNGKARSKRYSSHLVLLRFSIVPDTAVSRALFIHSFLDQDHSQFAGNYTPSDYHVGITTTFSTKSRTTAYHGHIDRTMDTPDTNSDPLRHPPSRPRSLSPRPSSRQRIVLPFPSKRRRGRPLHPLELHRGSTVLLLGQAGLRALQLHPKQRICRDRNRSHLRRHWHHHRRRRMVRAQPEDLANGPKEPTTFFPPNRPGPEHPRLLPESGGDGLHVLPSHEMVHQLQELHPPPTTGLESGSRASD